MSDKKDERIPRLGPQDPTKRTSPIKMPSGAICYYNGEEYSEGATVCGDGRLLECWSDGTWYDKGSC